MTELICEAKNHQNINSMELIRRREAAGLSQQQLADKVAKELGRASLSQVYIVQLESLNNPDIPVEMAEALAAVLKNYK